jgi:hypothetical protein
MRTEAPGAGAGMRWLPASDAGRWTVGLAALALGGTVGLAIAFAVGLEPADSFSDNWLLTGVGGAILGSAAASAVTGGIAFARRRDRSWLVVVGTSIGVLVALSMLQQVAEGLGWLEG